MLVNRRATLCAKRRRRATRQAAEILRVGAGGGWWWGDSESEITRVVKIAVVIQEDSTGRCKFMKQSVPVISDESPDFERAGRGAFSDLF